MQSHGNKRTPEGKWCAFHLASKAVAKTRLWLDWDFLVVHLLVGLHSVSLVSGVDTIAPSPPRAPPHAWGSENFVVGLSPIFSASLICVGTTLEFKEIRKEWKARKKEEDNQRKADEERQRSTGGGSQGDGQSAEAAQAPTGQAYGAGVRPHLPPIGYAPAGSQAPAPYPAAVDQMYQQNNGQVYSGYPHSPYVQGQQMYGSRFASPVPVRRCANIGQIINAAAQPAASVSSLCARVLVVVRCA